MNVDVRIDRIVVDGITLAAHDETPFRDAVEHELSRLLKRGVSDEIAASPAYASLRAPSIELRAAPSARELGRDVARAVYRSIGVAR